MARNCEHKWLRRTADGWHAMCVACGRLVAPLNLKGEAELRSLMIKSGLSEDATDGSHDYVISSGENSLPRLPESSNGRARSSRFARLRALVEVRS